jgi:mRNA interferase MazF
MTRFDAGDVVLVRYPFTDLTTTKKRPAIVLSSTSYADRFRDVVLMPLTSQTDSELSLAISNWAAAGLVKPTWIKPSVGTLSVRLIIRRLGTLHAEDTPVVRAALSILLAECWR